MPGGAVNFSSPSTMASKKSLTVEALARHEQKLGLPDKIGRADVVLSQFNRLQSLKTGAGAIPPADTNSDIVAALSELTSKKTSVEAARRFILQNWHRAEPIAQTLRRNLQLACADGREQTKKKMGAIFVVDDVMRNAQREGGETLKELQAAFGPVVHELMRDSVKGLGDELRPARENARLEIGSQRGRNSHQISILGIYDLQGLNYGRAELLVAGM